MRVGHLLVGPPEHGVTRYARELAEADGAPPPPPAGADVVQLHYTDRLFAPTAEESAAAFTAMAAELDRPLVVTLHDVPPDDGSVLQRRRARAYAAVVARADRVVVNSAHEAARLAAFSPVVPAVVPLPVQPLPPGPVPPPDGEVVVLGFLYPGKGHDEALRALPPGAGLTALGRPSDGHADLVDELSALGPFTVTGYVPDEELPARLRAASVPLAPHRHVSASGSIGSWLAAGRRPLVPDVGYTREVAVRCPGALWRYDDLAPALARALAEPALTWLPPGTPTGPDLAATLAAYREVWGSC